MTSEGASVDPVGAAPPLLKDRYELGERLAEGTFFFTHRGRDTDNGRSVAIKVLKLEYRSDEDFSSRLLSEAQAVSALRHPNIARVFDAWVERGALVIVTEWVPGASLKDRIRRVAPFPLAVSMDILLACTEALHYAHGKGFTHGDVRPDNVIVTPDGQVKLTGFGVGVSTASSTRSQLDALPRAVHYLAPELTEGRKPEPSADIYALGCMLYEMLSGMVPFDGDSPLAVAGKHVNAPVPSVRQANPAVPNAVDGVAAKCMQKSPAARYAGAHDLVQDIQTVREALRTGGALDWSPLEKTGESVPVVEKKKAPPRTQVRREPKRPARRESAEPAQAHEDHGPSGRLLAALALLAVLMVAGSFGIFLLSTRAPREVPVPDVVKMSQAEASALLKKSGLNVEIREEYNERVPAGTVFDSAPKGGVTTRRGKAVTLVVSRGPQPVTVPDVVGNGLGEAQAAVQSKGLVLEGAKEEFSEVVKKGLVISQTPVGGTSVAKKTAVTLVVSKGPQPVPEPEAVQVEPTPPDDPVNPDDSNPDADPARPSTGAVDLPARDYEIVFTVPADRRGSQTVKIVVRNEDGSESDAHEQTYEPGEEVKQTIPVLGAVGKCQIRVYLNGSIIKREKV